MIFKPFTSCDGQTYHSIWANEYWILLFSAGVTQKTLLVIKEWLFCAAQWQLGVWRDLCAPNIKKKKKAPEVYGESHRLGNFRIVISSISSPVVGFFLQSWTNCFCFLLFFSLPYLYMVLAISTVGFPTPGIIPGITTE